MVDLRKHQELVVRQEVEHLEVFTGLETSNRYSVMTPEGETLLYAYEESGFLGRQFLRNHRPLTLHVVDNESKPFLTATRGFFWFLSHLHVRDASDGPVGSLRRRFAVLKRTFSLEDPAGRPLAEVRGQLIRPNTFMVYKQGSEVARITKQWSGALREVFSDADTFHIQVDHSQVDQNLARLVLATAFAIDLDFFESGGGSSFGFGG